MEHEMTSGGTLFDRVVQILEQARANVVQSVNTNMVRAHWLIGREIVVELQGGEERAGYGKQVIETLSRQLGEQYGQGYSTTNLWYFRQFYQVYADRMVILHPAGGELSEQLLTGFSPQLSWSHYRALMKVATPAAREFYERESIECGWSKTQLERQIQTSYYDRILARHGEQGLLPAKRERLAGEQFAPIDVLKSPMVLEFLDLPDTPDFHESELEQAIIDNLQSFLLELGKGFSFVARQKHIRFDDDDFYIDLVFYNFMLKCFLLIELKLGKLTHRDVGQMDGYVRLFEERFKVPGDNPTIGLILCSDKSEAVARYSVLHESRQIFASRYLQFLPTEEELQLEIAKERRLVEAHLVDRDEQDSQQGPDADMIAE